MGAYFINNGYLCIKNEFAEECVNLLKKEIGYDEDDDCIDWIEDRQSGISEITFEDVDGDIGEDIQKVADLFKERGIEVYGSIEYYGSNDGHTVIKDNVVRDYDNEDYGANESLKGNQIGLELKEKLLNELENFNGKYSIEILKKMINEATTAD